MSFWETHAKWEQTLRHFTRTHYSVSSSVNNSLSLSLSALSLFSLADSAGVMIRSLPWTTRAWQTWRQTKWELSSPLSLLEKSNWLWLDRTKVQSIRNLKTGQLGCGRSGVLGKSCMLYNSVSLPGPSVVILFNITHNIQMYTHSQTTCNVMHCIWSS